MNFVVDAVITFVDEPETPYTVQAANEKWAVCTRPATQKDFEDFEFEDLNVASATYESVMYSIVDLEKKVRGPDFWVFGKYDYTQRSGCERCLKELSLGVCQMSRRNSAQFSLI